MSATHQLESAPSRPLDHDEQAFASWMNILLRGRRMLFLSGLIGAIGTAAVVLHLPRAYTSSAVIMPEGGRRASPLGGLASQLNIPLPGDSPSESPAFYADLIKSRELLGATVDSRFRDKETVRGKDRLSTLVEVLDANGTTQAARREDAIDRLSEHTSVDVVARTGVIRLSVTAETPELARSINLRLIELLDQFNRNRRKGRAAVERQFTERRLADERTELRNAEDRLQNFLQQNRDWTNSPALTFQHDRLRNDVALRRDLYASIAKAYETSRLEEVRDTPVITIVEAPSVPVRPDGRGTTPKTVYGLLGGLLFGTLLVFLRALRNPPKSGSDAIAEFHRLRRDLLYELLHPGVVLRGALPQRRQP